MALVIADRVRETTSVVGTGTATLLGAVTGYQTFSVIGNANTTYYCIAGQGNSEWEVGLGTYASSGTTLARTTVLASSNAGALVNFSAGTKDVFVTYPSEKSVNLDAAGLLTAPAGLGTGIPTFLATPSSANLAAAVTDETGSGALVFGTAPTLDTAVITATGSTAALRITNTGTGNSLLVEDSANPDSTPFVVDNAGNVGVGTTAPYTKIEVVGGAISIGTGGTASNLGIEILPTQDAIPAAQTRGYIATGNSTIGVAGDLLIAPRTNTTASIRFITGSVPSERMRLDASGNLGLAVTPSAWGTNRSVLEVGKPSVTSVTSSFSSGSALDLTYNGYFDGTNWKYKGSYFATKYSSDVGQHQWSIAPSGTAGAAITFTQAMTLDASGNLGVGTTSPGSKLDVKGTLRLSGSSSGYVGLAPAAAAGSTTYTLPSADGSSGQVLSTNGTGTLSWASGASIANDTTTATFEYPLFAAATSGTPTTLYTSNAKYLYKPSTGELQAPTVNSTNGIIVNSQIMTTSQTIAAGTSGFTVGPFSIASGAVLTIQSGARHVII